MNEKLEMSVGSGMNLEVLPFFTFVKLKLWLCNSKIVMMAPSSFSLWAGFITDGTVLVDKKCINCSINNICMLMPITRTQKLNNVIVKPIRTIFEKA